MSPLMITNCFEETIKNDLLTEYLFESHFHVLFWRRNKWFGPSNYCKIIRAYVEKKHEVIDKEKKKKANTK
jgi:hypothetical protein